MGRGSYLAGKGTVTYRSTTWIGWISPGAITQILKKSRNCATGIRLRSSAQPRLGSAGSRRPFLSYALCILLTPILHAPGTHRPRKNHVKPTIAARQAITL